jgi:hypothetical protein
MSRISIVRPVSFSIDRHHLIIDSNRCHHWATPMFELAMWKWMPNAVSVGRRPTASTSFAKVSGLSSGIPKRETTLGVRMRMPTCFDAISPRSMASTQRSRSAMLSQKTACSRPFGIMPSGHHLPGPLRIT